jgi:hypothetical protein
VHGVAHSAPVVWWVIASRSSQAASITDFSRTSSGGLFELGVPQKGASLGGAVVDEGGAVDWAA